MTDGCELTDVGSIETPGIDRHEFKGVVEIESAMAAQIEIQRRNKIYPAALACIGIIDTITEKIRNVKPDVTLGPESKAPVILHQIEHFSSISFLKHPAAKRPMGLPDSGELRPQRTIFQKQISICFFIMIQLISHHKVGPPATWLSVPGIMDTTFNIPIADHWYESQIRTKIGTDIIIIQPPPPISSRVIILKGEKMVVQLSAILVEFRGRFIGVLGTGCQSLNLYTVTICEANISINPYQTIGVVTPLPIGRHQTKGVLSPNVSFVPEHGRRIGLVQGSRG